MRRLRELSASQAQKDQDELDSSTFSNRFNVSTTLPSTTYTDGSTGERKKSTTLLEIEKNRSLFLEQQGKYCTLNWLYCLLLSMFTNNKLNASDLKFGEHVFIILSWLKDYNLLRGWGMIGTVYRGVSSNFWQLASRSYKGINLIQELLLLAKNMNIWKCIQRLKAMTQEEVSLTTSVFNSKWGFIVFFGNYMSWDESLGSSLG